MYRDANTRHKPMFKRCRKGYARNVRGTFYCRWTLRLNGRCYYMYRDANTRHKPMFKRCRKGYARNVRGTFYCRWAQIEWTFLFHVSRWQCYVFFISECDLTVTCYMRNADPEKTFGFVSYCR
jgi:hypothetical protein